ncbi:MAG: D-aminoacyl-tRNA deacylase [Acidimicrobiia bacterium]
MRAVVQRVSRASVAVDGETVSEIGPGLCVLVGVTDGDDSGDAEVLAQKLAGLRIFGDEDDKMNLSVSDVGGSVLVVSQFTLYGDVRKGRRPSFTRAAPAETAEELILELVDRLQAEDLDVVTGSFGARMRVDLTNDGPVTLVIDVEGGKVSE